MNKPKVLSIIYMLVIALLAIVAGTFFMKALRTTAERKIAWEEHRYQEHCKEMKQLKPMEIITSGNKLWMITGKFGKDGKPEKYNPNLILNPDGTPDGSQFTATQLVVSNITYNGKVTLSLDRNSTMSANFLEVHNER